MGKIGEMLLRAVDKIKSSDFPRTYSADDTKATVDGIKRLSFPGLLSILAAAPFDQDSDGGRTYFDDAATAVAEDDAFKESAIGKNQIAGFLKNVFQRGVPPSSLIDQGQIRRVILARAIEVLAKKAGADVTSQQVEEIVGLLETGKFFDDIASSTAAVVSTVQGVPIHLVKDLSPRKLTRVAFRIGTALPKDLGQASDFLPLDVVQDLLDNGRIDHSPGLLVHTFAMLYDLATVESTAKMVRTLIHRDNRSVRIAVIIYARANGIKLEEKDLDAVYEALDPSNPDLSPLVTAAARNLSSRYAPAEARRLLDRLRSRTAL